MKRHKERTDISTNWMAGSLGMIRRRMAKALVGQAVSIAVDAKTIARGIVTDVLPEADIPEIVVEGTKYNLSQILTSTPAALSL